MLALALAAGCSTIKVRETQLSDRAYTAPSPASDPEAMISTGMLLQSRQPVLAMTHYRQAALSAFPSLRAENVSTEVDSSRTPEAQHAYRRAIEYLIVTADQIAKNEQIPWTEALGRAGIAVQGKISDFDPVSWNEALPTRGFEVEGFLHNIARGGLGAPLVLKRSPPETTGQSNHYFPSVHFKSATALLRPAKSPDGPLAVLELHDPVLEPDMLWSPAPGHATLPLAYDMTVPLARQLTVRHYSVDAILGVLNPTAFEKRVGLYMLDSYQPGKIPVVFVHGLASSPQAWAQAMNELRGDPELRKKFQFWSFYYTTGNPIAASAAKLRASLLEAKQKFDPESRDPAFNQMVMIGHSMGGILTRLNITTSGDALWNLVAKVPPDQLDLDPDLKKNLVEATYFEPFPAIRRVIFVATPHRGSPLGYEFAGRLASSLIRLPQFTREMTKAIAESSTRGELSPLITNRRQMTSVAQLASDNPMLQAFNSLPINPEVTYHSIVGYNGKGTLETGGDGIVPYTSAHIEGAASEIIVTSDHSSQSKEPSILEMKRILLLHLAEFENTPLQASFSH